MIRFIARKARGFRRGGRRVVKVSRPERVANREARERLAEGVADRLLNLFDGIREDIPIGRVEGLLARPTTVGEIMAEIGFPEALQGVDAEIRQAIIDGVTEGAKIADDLGSLEGFDLDRISSAASDYLVGDGLARIQGIDDQTMRAVAETIQRVLDSDLSLSKAATDIGRAVGLTTRDAQALSNFEARLLRERIPVPEADTQLVRESIARDVENYRTRLLRQRGLNIAETEIQNAIQHGERAYWEEAIRGGDVETPPRKTWFTVADERVCPICEPLHRVTVGFNDTFVGGDGVARLRPPAHPRCRCYVDYEEQ